MIKDIIKDMKKYVNENKKNRINTFVNITKYSMDYFDVEELLNYIDELEISNDALRYNVKHKIKKCEICGRKDKTTKYIPEPYDFEINGIENMMYLCESCDSRLSEDI
jgi:hypothetical protein